MASYALENEYFIKPSGASWDEDPLYKFDNSQIVLNSPKGVFSSDIIGNELAVDQFSFTVRFNASGRRLYIFNNEPKLAYIFSGYVPGTLETCGWISQTRGDPIIAGNSVAFASSSDGFYLSPPASVRESQEFLANDVIRLKIKVNENSDRLYFYDTHSRSFTVESQTELFTFNNGWVNTYAYTTGTGTDILTITFTGNNYGIIHVYSRADSQFEITGFEFNGEMVFGSLSDATEADKPPKVYLFRPKYDASRFLADLAFGDPCYWTVDSKVLAKGYISAVERTGRYAWKVSCVSGVGLLDEKVSVGGIFTGETFSTVFAQIVGDAFGYTIDADVGAVQIFGWLPYDSARNNLHRLLFATGAALARHNISSDGNDYDYDVKFPGKVIRIVPSDHVALSGSVTLNIPADGVEVTEHAYAALNSDEEVQLYDNTLPEIAEADHLTVTFSEPMHDLNAGGFTIHESGVNYAVISGTGILTGKKYTHTETVYPLGNPLGTIVKRIVSNGLITFANSLNVARRVLNYFQSAKAVKAKLLLDGSNGAQSAERPGDTLQMTDAWGEPISAYMSKQEVSVTSVYGASVELVDGYTPTGGGNNYQRYKFIKRSDASKTFTVPAGVTTVRIVLIQGGSGGEGGWNGHDGWGGYPPSFGDPEDGQMVFVEDEHDPLHPDVTEVQSYIYNSGRQQPAPGGAAGDPGANGKITVVTKTVTEGEVLTFTVGAGGVGGAGQGANEAPGTGTSGGETSVSSSAGWTASSEDGAAIDSGFFEAFTNQSFALPGEDGFAGGDGGTTDVNDTDFANKGARGNSGGSVGRWRAGAPGNGVIVDAGWGFLAEANNTASGGGSGGAAYGANGGAGRAASYVKQKNDDSTWTYRVTTGTGGDGANASKPVTPTFGQGGGGGNGGGGGGNNGGGLVRHYFAEKLGAQLLIGVRHTQQLGKQFNGGDGGLGSNGGDGGDGLGIIYY